MSQQGLRHGDGQGDDPAWWHGQGILVPPGGAWIVHLYEELRLPAAPHYLRAVDPGLQDDLELADGGPGLRHCWLLYHLLREEVHGVGRLGGRRLQDLKGEIWKGGLCLKEHTSNGLLVAITVMRVLMFFIEHCHKEGNVLFNDACNTFYLRLYGVRHMVKDHSDSEKGNPLLPHRLLFLIDSKGSFICTIPHRITHTTHGLCYTSRGSLAGTRNSSVGSPHEGSIRRPIAP